MTTLDVDPPVPADLWHRHAAAALVVTTMAVAAGVVLMAADAAVPRSWQVAVLVVGVAVVGMPHGSLDGRVAEILLRPRLGRMWGPVFGVGYLGVAGLVLLLWLVAPAVGLAGFLAVSVLHFGLGDTEMMPAGPSRAAAVLVRGLMPITLPAVLHRAEVAELFGLLAGPAAGQVGADAAWWIGLATVAAASFWVLSSRPLKRASHRIVSEFVALTAVLLILPPLLGFAVYFCVWHSPRHLLGWVAAHEARRVAAMATPLTVLTLALMLIAGLLAARLDPAAAFGDTAIRVTFIALAALTVPHMLLPLIPAQQNARESELAGVAQCD